MKTFFNLIQDVQKQGKCHQCGGCVTFCSAINYGALGIDQDGKPRYEEIEKCIECGICHMICPETGELDDEIKKRAEWQAPAGRIIGTSVARARDLIVRERGTDGGCVTAVLLHLFDTGRINGAIVSKSTRSGRQPWLAKTREDIIDAAGIHLDHSHGMANFSELYSTFSPSIKALSELRNEGLERIAFVGTPCQINTIRRMQALGVVPADSIQVCLGLFCSGNFIMSGQGFSKAIASSGIIPGDIEKINIKDNLVLRLTTGERREVPLAALESVKRGACSYCDDFAAEYADISFGGIGAEDGWTTMVTRTRSGQEILADAMATVLEPYPYEDNPKFATRAENAMLLASGNKKERSAIYRRKQEKIQVTVAG